MSENEKRLRHYLEMFTSESAEQSLDDLDALLAEHRDEVKRLTEALTEIRTMHSQMCAVAAQHQRDSSAAGDAALEEAAAEIDGGQGTGSLALGGWYRRYADRIRALKSRPAERYLSESEVRDALRHLRDDVLASDMDAVSFAAQTLGVDLDAEGERCAGCGKRGTDLCATCEDEARTSQNAMAVEDTRQTCTCAGQGICEWCDAQVSP